jgi:HAD superfamily hydrolase (TIGR01662 family)
VVAEPDVSERADGKRAMTEVREGSPTASRRRARAVSFDFGQTIAGIDNDLLMQKLERLGVSSAAGDLESASRIAWGAYDAAVRAGIAGHPWKLFMRTFLENGLVPRPSADEIERAVDALWDDQPKVNLWRRALPDMIELVKELRSAGIPHAILSNSEGRLLELIAEMGIADLFPIVGDSGRLGLEKPDPRMFHWAAEKLGVDISELIHVGDSLGADVEGAERAGAHGIWFRAAALGMTVGDVSVAKPPLIATTAASLRAHLVSFGLLGG